MRTIVLAAALTAALANPALAQTDYSAGSNANSWNLLGEQKAKFEGVAIDALCILTGDCPADCGAGKRQMGILRSDDGVFMLANKNGQPVFTGATVDLAPYCGETVEIDGLLVGDRDVTPGLGDARLLQIQTVRRIDEDDVHKTDLWTRRWEERNEDLGGEGPWFERDPDVNAAIEADGRLGLGLEADQKFIEENF